MDYKNKKKAKDFECLLENFYNNYFNVVRKVKVKIVSSTDLSAFDKNSHFAFEKLVNKVLLSIQEGGSLVKDVNFVETADRVTAYIVYYVCHLDE